MASGIQLNSTNNSEMNIVYQGTSGATRTVIMPDKDMTVAGLDDLKEIGVGQTWQDVTASRSAGVTYTNTTGKPIVVSYASSGSTPAISITVNGIVVANVIDSAGTNLWVSAIIPNGNTYIVDCSDTYGQSWKELR